MLRKATNVAMGAFFLLALSFPPWEYTMDAGGLGTFSRGAASRKPAGFRFILTPPKPERDYGSYGVRLDLSRLAVELGALTAAAITLWTLTNPRSNLPLSSEPQ